MIDEILGRFTCPHVDGNFEISVRDMTGWSTGSCLIRQEGQGQVHDIVVTRDEAKNLAAILLKFSAA